MVALLWSVSAIGVTQKQIRFHCSNDTTEINALLKRGYDSGVTSPNALVAQYGRWLLGRPYVAHTLEGETELLTVNIDELDCTTFVETLYALTRCTLEGRYSWRDFAHHLENVRYRGGKMDGYASRLHYMSEWSVDNCHRGNLKEVTQDLRASKYEVKTINFMTANRDKYPALRDSAMFERVKSMEIGYRNHRFPYIKYEWMKMKELQKDLREGDFVGIVCKIAGLDVQHMGVVVMEKGVPHLLNASSAGGVVRVEADDIIEYVRRNKTAIGLRVWRIVE